MKFWSLSYIEVLSGVIILSCSVYSRKQKNI